MIDVYDSAIDHAGRFAAVFERDDDTAYFYLLDLGRGQPGTILEHLSVSAVNSMPADVPVCVRWSSSVARAELIVAGKLVAVFDLTRPAPHGRLASE